MRYPILRLLLALTFMAWSATSLAQTCNTAIAADAPDSRYKAYSNGTVRDKQTGLVWKRCAEGQTWQAGSCAGSPASFTWVGALAVAEQVSFAGSSNWRLPNKKELKSLVEHRCYSPAINLAVFPNAPDGWFWSSSPDADLSGNAWVVDFSYGYGNVVSENGGLAVRLVRAGQ